MEDLVNFLKLVTDVRMTNRALPDGIVYAGIEDLVRQRGRSFGPPKPTPIGTPRACFDNSYRLSRKKPWLTYCEGFAMSLIPLHHAWCCDDHGSIYDPTWDQDHATAYLGLALERDYVHREYKRKGYAGVLTTDYEMAEEHVLAGKFILNSKLHSEVA